MNRSIMFVIHNCYLDDSNGAVVASRSMMEALTRHGFATESLSGTAFEHGQNFDLQVWKDQTVCNFESEESTSWSVDARGVREDLPPHDRLNVRGVSVTLFRCKSTNLHEPDDAECDQFLRLCKVSINRSRPDVLVNYGGHRLAHEIRSLGSVKK